MCLLPKWTKKEDIDRILRVAKRLKYVASRFDVPDKRITPRNYLDRNCPVCSSTDRAHIGEREIQSPTPKGWYTFRHNDVRCVACGFYYSTNIAEPSYIDNYYRDTTAYAGVDYNAQNRIEVIERLAPKGSRILEYGAGRGEFAELLGGMGYKVDAVDMDDGIIEETYDLICCYYTLEHLVYPNDALKMFRGLLSKGGVLIVEVPDFEKNYKTSMHFQHINHFTKDHLILMLINNGFESIEMIEGHSRDFGVAFISTCKT